jgi:hypothetical protein
LSVQEIGISSGTPPVVRRPAGTTRFDLTFEGTREAKVSDRHTRLRISLSSNLAAQLWHQLGAQLEDWEKQSGVEQ